MRSVHRGELDRISNEERRLIMCTSAPRTQNSPLHKAYSVVKHPIEVTLVGVQLHSPAVNIANGISRSALGADGRNSQKSSGLLANFLEEAGRGNVGAVVGAFELTVGAVQLISRLLVLL